MVKGSWQREKLESMWDVMGWSLETGRVSAGKIKLETR